MLPDIAESRVFEWFMSYAYEPEMVYLGILLFMYASSFGLPFPEEIIIVASGIVAFIAHNPDLYPPPTPDAQGVNLYLTATVCFLGVFTSDFLVYSIGRFFGPRIITRKWFKRMVGPQLLARVMQGMNKYGYWACAIFRFTPGLRFPGHLACGMTKMPLHKFLLIDGFVAGISVPTQILLIGLYGETVLNALREAKIVILCIIGLGLLWFVARWLRRRWFPPTTLSKPPQL